MKCDWKAIAFGELLKEPVRNGLTKPKAIRGSGVKMIAMGELFAYSRISNIVTDRVPVTEKEFQNCSIKPLDILFARQSLTLEGAGKCSIVTDASEDTVFESHLIRTQVDQRKADPFFLYYYFNSPHGKENIKSIVEQVAAAGIRGSDLIKLLVPYPCLEEQKKISAILRSLDDKIELNNKINDNLFEMVNACYKKLFVPQKLELATVDTYALKIYSGGTPTTSNATYWKGPFSWLSSGETRNRFIVSTEKTITQEGINNSSTKLAHKYDIVMASAGQGFTRGQTSMLFLDTYVNQSVIVIHADKIYLPFIFWNLANRYEELRAISDSSSIRGSLTTRMIASFEIPAAAPSTIADFSDFAWSIIPQIESNLLENARLTMIRDTLLPKLMSGEIDVSRIRF